MQFGITVDCQHGDEEVDRVSRLDFSSQLSGGDELGDNQVIKLPERVLFSVYMF